MATEVLESRNLLAAVTYVNDDWHFVFDVDNSASLTVGDIVSRAPGTDPFGAYGQTAFGTVATGDHTGTVGGAATIQNALDNTDVGGTLNILAGNYTEQITINQSSNIVGEGSAVTILNVTSPSTGITLNSSASISGISTVNSGAGVNIGVVVQAGMTGTLSDVSVSGFGVGIFVIGAASITGSPIFGNNTGVFVANGASVTAFANNNFDGGSGSDNDTDVRLAASAAAFSAGGNNIFAGETFYIENLSSLDIDLATPGGNTFDEASNFRVEDKMFHAVDDPTLALGLVTWVADTIFITTPDVGSTDSDINRGIALSDPGDTVQVEAGTYTELVTVNKDGIQLLGAQAGVDARTRSGAETIIHDSLGRTGIWVRANDVRIDGFTVQGQTNVNQFGAGIVIEANREGTQILNNIVQNNVVGLFLSNNPGGDQARVAQNLFQNNTNPGAASGTHIYADEFTAGADMDNVLVEDNTFTNTSLVVNSRAFNLSNTGATAWTGITFDDNDVSNMGRGVNAFGTSGLTITNNTFNGATNQAIAFVAGAVPNSGAVVDNNVFTNNFRGIFISGTGAYSGTLAPSGNTFTGGTYHLVNNGAPAVIDATGNTYDGVLLDGSTSLADIFAIADKVLDRIDVASYGQIILRSGNEYVTPNSFFAPDTTTPSIQRGVDAADPSETVHVAAGTYPELVNVNKSVTLLGAQAGVDARTRTGPESIVADAAGRTGIWVTANDVTVDGFTVQGQTNVNQFGAGIVIAANIEGTQVLNNIVQNNVVGLFLSNNPGGDQARVAQNLFQNNTNPGAASGHAIYADEFTAGADMDNVLIEDNAFTNSSTVVNSWALGLSNTGATAWTGITFDDNDVSNSGRGVYAFGTSGLAITNNTFDGATNYAVGIFNGAVPNTGAVVDDNAFTNNFRGIWIDGPGSYSGTLAPGGNTFTGGTYHLVNSGAPAVIDATGNTYDGVLLDGSTALADIFAIADKVLDRIDVASYGQIILRAGNEYVTPNSFFAPDTTTPSIQRGVDAADPGETVHVAAGTFTELVTVNKTLNLRGAQAGVDARTRTAVPETIVNNPGGSFSLLADNIVLDGFTVEGATGAPLGTGINASASASGHQILNNIIQDNVFGMYFNSNGTFESIVEQNVFRDNNNPGSANGTGLYSDGGLSNARIRNNLFAGDNFTAGLNLAGTQSDITISGNTFADGNQVVLFSTDNSLVDNNDFSGVIPSGGTGSGVFLGGGVDNLTISNNTFTDRGAEAISASDFGSGVNTNIIIEDNTISQDVGVLEASSSMINLSAVDGAQVTQNTVGLKGTYGAATFAHAISVFGAATDNVDIFENDLLGRSVGGGNAGVRLRSTLASGAVVDITNNKIHGFDTGVLGEILTAGVDVNVHDNRLAGNGLAVANGAGELIDASANWLGSNTPTGAAATVSGPVDYSPWLETAVDTDGGALGFAGSFSALNVDDNSPQAPGFAGYVDEALSLLDDDGTLFLHAGTYTENVNTSSQAVTLEIGKGTAGVVLNGSLTLDSDDTLAVDLGSLASDLLDVTGAVTIGNATLDVDAIGTLAANNTIVVLKRGSGTDFFGNVSQGQQLTVGSQSVTARYDLGDGNDFGFITFSHPVVSNIGGAINFTEQGPFVLLLPSANLDDADTPAFNGGQLSVAVTSGGDTGDILAIRNIGFGPGQIGVVGNQVQYGGVTFGTFSGGTGGSPLIVTFTNDGNATVEAVEKLIRAIQYRNISNDPNPGTHSVLFLVEDGVGGVGAAIKNVNLTAVNDAPNLTIDNAVPNYTENNPPVSIGTGALLSDPDSDNFDNGMLTVDNTTADAGDLISIATTAVITLTGNTVNFNGTPIGTFTGGDGSNPLVVSLNSNATVQAVRGLLLALRYSHVGDNPTPGNRTITIQLEEGDGTQSPLQTRNVNVIAVNDAPTVTGGDTINTTVGGAPAAIASNAVVTDPDSANLGGGSLRVHIASGAQANDRLNIAFGGPYSLSGNQILVNGTTVIGTINANYGQNGNDIVISFNSNATPTHAQQLARRVTFRTTSGAGTRVIELSVDDDASTGNGVGQITSTVNVS